jgi:RNA polymerase sigma factor (sigma-70 family)
MQPAIAPATEQARPAWYDQKLVEHTHLIRSIAYKRRYGVMAEELVQDIYVSALQRWHYYDEKHEFGIWIRLVASHVMARQREKAGRIKRTAKLVPIKDVSPATPPTQHDYAELSETLRRLSGTRDSDVLMRYAMGEELGEIAVDYGVSRNRIHQLCQRERERLAARAAA